MADLVEIVNGNGKKGRVAATSRAAAEYRNPPSGGVEADPSVPAAPGHPSVPSEQREPLVRPANNAAKDAWVAFATDVRNTNRLSPEEAAEMSRGDLAAHYPSEEN